MKNNKILFCVGTRPEWVKIKPVIDAMDASEYSLYHTGQHVELLDGVAFEYISSKPNSADNRLDSVFIKCLDNFPNESFKGVVVQGDTASAFACAIAAFNRKIPVYYLESGLRTNDMENPYPEEGYRQMISRIASVHFAPTETAKAALVRERVFGDIYVVGNTVLDNLVYVSPIYYGNTVLVTMHRTENHEIMNHWFSEIERIAANNKELTFILPLHPNPNVSKHRHILKTVKVVEPMYHADFIDALKTCRFVITDSGGLQEEASFLNKKSIVCRKTTERSEGTITGHTIMCNTPDDLVNIFNIVNADYEIHKPCPYGDGNSSSRIVKILRNGYWKIFY